MTLSDSNPVSRSSYSSKANISQTVHATAGNMTSRGFLSDIAEVSCFIFPTLISEKRLCTKGKLLWIYVVFHKQVLVFGEPFPVFSGAKTQKFTMEPMGFFEAQAPTYATEHQRNCHGYIWRGASLMSRFYFWQDSPLFFHGPTTKILQWRQ